MTFFGTLRESMKIIDEEVAFVKNFDTYSEENKDFFLSTEDVTKLYNVNHNKFTKTRKLANAALAKLEKKNLRHYQFDFLYYDLFLDFVDEFKWVVKRLKPPALADFNINDLLADEEESSPESGIKDVPELAEKDSVAGECLESVTTATSLLSLNSGSQEEAMVLGNKEQELKLAEIDSQGSSIDVKAPEALEIERPVLNLLGRYDSPTFLEILKMAEEKVAEEPPASVVQQPKDKLSVEPDWPPSTVRATFQEFVEDCASYIKTKDKQAKVPCKGPSLNELARRLDFDSSSFSAEED